MSHDHPIELAFPCPSCGVRLTIQQTVATGPCPHCQTPIQVELKAEIQNSTPEPPLKIQEEVVYLKNSFDRRRFRPAAQAPNNGNKSYQHPSQL